MNTLNYSDTVVHDCKIQNGLSRRTGFQPNKVTEISWPLKLSSVVCVPMLEVVGRNKYEQYQNIL